MLKIKPSSGLEVAKTEVAQATTHLIQKASTPQTDMVMAKSQVQLEDEFSNMYYTTQDQSKLFLQPPFDPSALLQLVQTNNTLMQCVAAMEVNVDGTGHQYVTPEGVEKLDEKEKALLDSMLGEPYPNTTFMSIRRRLRREIESVGYGYLEVLRNIAGEIVGFRNVLSHNVRMVKLDAAVLVKKKLVRNGQEVELQMWERERRFAQRVAMKDLVYYREFGATRNVHRSTGEWIDLSKPEGAAVPPSEYGTELLVFGEIPDIKTPYYVPQWVNQMPSVVGSRKAEEQNLEFLDSGGMPPAIIFIQGGTLASDASDQLKEYLSGKNKNKYRAAVVEAQSSSGSMDSTGTVQVKVERFGAEQAKDAMYQNYDNKTEERVRMGFRLPPLFLGKAADYNFATAITAYMVAEAQVFQPARTKFDDVFNATIVRALGLKTVRLKSNPITLKDVGQQLTALGLAKELVDAENFVEEVNKITGLTLEAKEPPPEGTPMGPGTVMGPNGHPVSAPPSLLEQTQMEILKGRMAGEQKPPGPDEVKQKRPMQKGTLALLDLSREYAALQGLVVLKSEMSAEEASEVLSQVRALKGEDLEVFNNFLASFTFGAATPDLVKVASCGHQH